MRSPTNSYRKSKRVHTGSQKWLLGTLLFLICLGVIGLVEERNIQDYFKLRNYNPPVAILNLAKDDTMTPYALKVFKVNHPSIEDKQIFSVNCPNDGGEKTIVLGCYHSDQAGIFLLNVNDTRLNGVQQVTAAHEMLHAAYDRLSTSERNKVDSMLLSYYNHGLTDPRIKQDINLYKQTEPHDVVNEMHSVFGTEIANLPAPLESYYKKYFTDRQKIAAYANQYEAAFTSRQTLVNQDDMQLSSMKTQIQIMEADIKTKYSAVTSEQNTLSSEKTSNVDAYNAALDGYNQQVDAYNNEVNSLKTLVAQYNTLVSSRNSVALSENQLSQELSGVTTK
jgi:hypothetical protein